MISRTPLDQNGVCMLVILRRMPRQSYESGYLESPSDLWCPLSLGVYARLKDGFVEEIEDTWAWKALLQNLEWEGSTKELFHALEEGEVKVNQDGVLSPVAVTYLNVELAESLSQFSVEKTQQELESLERQIENRDVLVNLGGEAASVRTLRQLSLSAVTQIEKGHFHAMDPYPPYQGDGALALARTHLTQSGKVTPEQAEDIQVFDALCRRLGAMGVPWTPVLAIPEGKSLPEGIRILKDFLAGLA